MSGEQQEQVFKALSGACCLTLDELTASVSMTRREVVKVVGRLVELGLVERVEKGCYRHSEEGKKADIDGFKFRSGPRGKHTGNKKTWKTSLRLKVWRVLRFSRKNTIEELVSVCAEGSEKDAYGSISRYLNHLRKPFHFF